MQSWLKKHGNVWWLGAHVAMYVVFLIMLYFREETVLDQIRPIHGSVIQNMVQGQLEGLTWFFLPQQAWRLFVPFSVLALGVLLLGRLRWLFLSLAGFALSLLSLADSVYYRFFSAILSVDSLRVAHQLYDVRGSVFAELSPMGLLWPFLFFGFFLYGRVNRGHASWERKKDPVFYWADRFAGVLFLLLAAHCGRAAYYLQGKDFRVNALAGNGLGADEVPGFFRLENCAPKDYATYFGLFNYHLSDLGLTVKEAFRDRAIGEADLKAMAGLLEEKKELNQTNSPFEGIAAGRNVVLISMESFQYFLLGMEIEGREVTPALNRLARQGLCFDFILNNIDRGGTSDAEFMVMTGLLPDNRRKTSLSYPAKRTLLALPARLRDVGFHTFSLHGNDPAFWNRHINHPVYGFDQMVFEKSFNYPYTGLGIPDTVFLDRSAGFLAQAPQPFFAFVITLSSHHPYNLVPLSEDFFPTPFPGDSLVARYLRAAHYADGALAGFLEKMEDSALWENTLFVIYGDHTAPLDRESRELLADRLGLDTTLYRSFRVPMIVLIPGKEADIAASGGAFREIVGGLQDLFPTVLHLLGLEIPFGIYGTHFFVPNDRRGALPFTPVPNGFIEQGVLYVNGGRLTDRDGLVFLPRYDLPKLAPDEVRRKVLRINAEMVLHHLIFDADAQKRVIDYRKEHPTEGVDSTGDEGFQPK